MATKKTKDEAATATVDAPVENTAPANNADCGDVGPANDNACTDVATADTASTAIAAPSQGFKVETKAEDMMVPFLAVLQQLSDVVTKGKDAYNPEAEAGDVYDKVTRMVYTGCEIVVADIKKYYGEWEGDVRGRLVGKHATDSDVVKNAVKEDAVSSKGNTYTKLKTASGNDLIETFGVVCVAQLDGMVVPATFTLAKTSFMAGKTLSSLIALQQQRGVPKFRFDTVTASNDKGTWYKPTFTYIGSETNEEVIGLAQSLNKISNTILFRNYEAESDPVAESNDI